MGNNFLVIYFYYLIVWEVIVVLLECYFIFGYFVGWYEYCFIDEYIIGIC